jgi:hypothetical protein
MISFHFSVILLWELIFTRNNKTYFLDTTRSCSHYQIHFRIAGPGGASDIGPKLKFFEFGQIVYCCSVML